MKLEEKIEELTKQREALRQEFAQLSQTRQQLEQNIQSKIDEYNGTVKALEILVGLQKEEDKQE